MKINNYKDLILVFSSLMMLLLALEVMMLRNNISDLEKERYKLSNKLEHCRTYQFYDLSVRGTIEK